MADKLFYTFFTLFILTSATNTNTSYLHGQTPIVIDSFQHPDTNALGFWHGPGENLHVEYSQTSPDHHHVRLYPTDPDQNYHTQVSNQRCTSLAQLQDHFLHVVFSGPDTFSISLNQNNAECLPQRNPYPATWDTVQAGRYTKARGQGQDQDQGKSQDVYVPLSHFKIDLSRVVSVSFSGFSSREPITLRRVEIVKILPAGTSRPAKLPNGQMVLRCTRPNSFAFGIDDGQPWLANEVMDILAEENVLVTFFAVGDGLRNPETNLTEVYREMIRRGHQIALHSNTHRKMEGLLRDEDIDNEIREGLEIFHDNLGIQSRYFRPPYGTVGARLRQHLAEVIPNPYIINWSVDVEDWLWAGTDTPERQLEAFARDLQRGGNLAVMHYLYPSTVAYFRRFIHMVKAAGLRIMRVDQCLEDPDAPAVYPYP